MSLEHEPTSEPQKSGSSGRDKELGDAAEAAVAHARSQPPTKSLHRNVLWYRGGLVFEAHRLLYHSAYGSRTLGVTKSWATQRKLLWPTRGPSIHESFYSRVLLFTLRQSHGYMELREYHTVLFLTLTMNPDPHP